MNYTINNKCTTQISPQNSGNQKKQKKRPNKKKNKRYKNKNKKYQKPNYKKKKPTVKDSIS